MKFYELSFSGVLTLKVHEISGNCPWPHYLAKKEGYKGSDVKPKMLYLLTLSRVATTLFTFYLRHSKSEV